MNTKYNRTAIVIVLACLTLGLAIASVPADKIPTVMTPVVGLAMAYVGLKGKGNGDA